MNNMQHKWRSLLQEPPRWRTVKGKLQEWSAESEQPESLSQIARKWDSTRQAKGKSNEHVVNRNRS
jgi:hypothetical protein